MLRLICLSMLVCAALCAPQLPAGVDALACPNYPFCTGAATPYATGTVGSSAPSPLTVELLAHQEAERRVIAQQAFTGLVGPSGNIGPSGLCGPSGCVQF